MAAWWRFHYPLVPATCSRLFRRWRGLTPTRPRRYVQRNVVAKLLEGGAHCASLRGGPWLHLGHRGQTKIHGVHGGTD